MSMVVYCDCGFLQQVPHAETLNHGDDHTAPCPKGGWCLHEGWAVVPTPGGGRGVKARGGAGIRGRAGVMGDRLISNPDQGHCSQSVPCASMLRVFRIICMTTINSLGGWGWRGGGVSATRLNKLYLAPTLTTGCYRVLGDQLGFGMCQTSVATCSSVPYHIPLLMLQMLLLLY